MSGNNCLKVAFLIFLPVIFSLTSCNSAVHRESLKGSKSASAAPGDSWGASSGESGADPGAGPGESDSGGGTGGTTADPGGGSSPCAFSDPMEQILCALEHQEVLPFAISAPSNSGQNSTVPIQLVGQPGMFGSSGFLFHSVLDGQQNWVSPNTPNIDDIQNGNYSVVDFSGNSSAILATGIYSFQGDSFSPENWYSWAKTRKFWMAWHHPDTDHVFISNVVDSVQSLPIDAIEKPSQSNGFGRAIDISRGWAVIGAPAAGKVYIYQRLDTGWVLDHTISKSFTPTSSAGHQFFHSPHWGSRVSIVTASTWTEPSNPRPRVAIADWGALSILTQAFGPTYHFHETGFVEIHERNSVGQWYPRGVLSAYQFPEYTGQFYSGMRFGHSLDWSPAPGPGYTPSLYVGAPGFENGAVYRVDYTFDSTPVSGARFTPSQICGNDPGCEDIEYGTSVDVSGDAIVVGAPGYRRHFSPYPSQHEEAGAIFVHSDAASLMLRAQNSYEGSRLGEQVSVSGDWIAASSRANGQNSQVLVYKKSGSAAWPLLDTLALGGDPGTGFGLSGVTLVGDSDANWIHLYVGDERATHSGFPEGAVHLYRLGALADEWEYIQGYFPATQSGGTGQMGCAIAADWDSNNFQSSFLATACGESAGTVYYGEY